MISEQKGFGWSYLPAFQIYKNKLACISFTALYFYCLMLTASSRACVLATDTDSPPVTKTSVSSDLLEALDIVTKLGIDVLSKNLGVLSSLEILLSVEEPKGDLELTGVLDNSNNLFDLISGKLSSSLVDIDFSLFANKIGETTSETLNFGQSENNISLSLNVSVENTENMLELSSLHQ